MSSRLSTVRLLTSDTPLLFRLFPAIDLTGHGEICLLAVALEGLVARLAVDMYYSYLLAR